MAVSVDKRCCVPNCENTREDDVILHVFPNPNKNRERFETWLSAIDCDMMSLDKNIVFKYRRVCHNHFEAKYYTTSKRLSANAVPTLKLKVTHETINNLVACQACLATDRKLYSLDTNLLEAYNIVMGNITDVSSEVDSPKYVCNYCSALLVKYNSFRDSCYHAKEVLEDAKSGNRIITMEHLKTLHLQFRSTTVKLLSINCIGQVTFDSLTHECQIDPLHESDNHDLKCDITKRPDDHTVKCDITKRPEDHNIKCNITKGPDCKINDKSDEHTCKYHTENSDETCERYDTIENIDENELSQERIRIKSVAKIKKVRRKEKDFETKENMKKFETAFDVDITVLSEDQQLQDVLDRRYSTNYLHSPYKCDLCYKGFMDEEILNRHAMSQHDPSRGDVVCDFCNFRYKGRRALNQHLKSHRLKFACRQCSFVSRTTFNAREHFKMHGGQMHQCAQCGKSYEKLTSYLSHMRIHHPSQFMWCDLCGEAFIREFGLNSHKKRAHRALLLESQCVACDKRFTSPPALQRHTRDVCRAVACVHCGEGFQDPPSLRDHLLKEHRTMKIYSCEKCGKSFTRESLYSAHYRRKHVNTTDSTLKKTRLWICEVCGKTLPNKCLLLYHQRNHTGERPYQCVQCPKSFTLKKLLQSHLRVHSTARPYACALCPKTFKGLSALRTHEHMHSEGRVRGHKKQKETVNQL